MRRKCDDTNSLNQTQPCPWSRRKGRWLLVKNMKAIPLATGQHKTHCALNYFKKSDCSAERSSLKKIVTTRLHTMVFKNITFLALNAMITVGLPDWQSENQIMVPEKSTFVISTLNILQRDGICVSNLSPSVCFYVVLWLKAIRSQIKDQHTND